MHYIHYLLPFCPEGINNLDTFVEDFTGTYSWEENASLLGNTSLVVFVEFK